MREKKEKKKRRRAAQNVQEWTVSCKWVVEVEAQKQQERRKGERKGKLPFFLIPFSCCKSNCKVQIRSVFFFLIAAVVATIASFSCPSIKKVPFPLLKLPVLTISFLAQFDRMFIFFLLVRRSLDC